LETIKDLIRYNNISDSGDACVAISPRCDLLDTGNILRIMKNLIQIGASIFGAIDGKVVNSNLIKTMTANIVSGPTTQGHPAFSWKNWENQVHRGMPETFNFDWLMYTAIVGPLPTQDKIIL